MKPRFRIRIWQAGLAALATMAALTGQAAPVPGQGTWESSLHARDLDGDGTADADYDSVLDVTWLRDRGLGGGPKTWDNAFAWADALSFGGHTAWRLPHAVDSGAPGCDWAMAGTDCGYNPLPGASELSHLFTVTLGNLSYYAPGDDIGDPAQPGWGLSNTAHFTGMLMQRYWTDTEVANAPSQAWTFAMWGFQGGVGKIDPDGGLSVWAVAVHDGDIGTPTAVSTPPSLALALAGLALLAAGRPGRRARRLWDTAGPS